MININLKGVERNLKYEILDFNCRKVQSGNIDVYENAAQIGIRDLQPGMYLIRLRNDKMQIAGKFVKL